MQLWSVNYKPPLNWTNTGIYQCIEHFGNQKTCIESKIGWFLKESFSYPGPFNDFDWEIFWSLKYIHAQKKNCKHTAMCLLSFADNKTFKSLHLTQKNTELQFNTDFEFSELFLCEPHNNTSTGSFTVRFENCWSTLQSYQRVQIYEWSITDNARGSIQWFQLQPRKYIKDLMYL